MLKNTILEQAFPPLKSIDFEFCKILNFGNHCKIMGKLRYRQSNGSISRNPETLDPIPPKWLLVAVLKLARGWRRITLELYEIKLYELLYIHISFGTRFQGDRRASRSLKSPQKSSFRVILWISWKHVFDENSRFSKITSVAPCSVLTRNNYFVWALVHIWSA